MKKRNGFSGRWLIMLVMLAVLFVGTAVSAFGQASRSGSSAAAGLVLNGKGKSSPELTRSRKKKKKKSSSQKAEEKETNASASAGKSGEADTSAVKVEEDGTYTSKDEVAAYLHEFGHLPDNYITKKEARNLGWDNTAGNLNEVAPGKSIGGDYFGNYEEQLPVVKGRDYYECDIDYTGGRRGAKRIIYSDDGYIYYTEDHYETFEQLYP